MPLLRHSARLLAIFSQSAERFENETPENIHSIDSKIPTYITSFVRTYPLGLQGY
jgi:hypothetical protein